MLHILAINAAAVSAWQLRYCVEFQAAQYTSLNYVTEQAEVNQVFHTTG
jgi:hypothetical protein